MLSYSYHMECVGHTLHQEEQVLLPKAMGTSRSPNSEKKNIKYRSQVTSIKFSRGKIMCFIKHKERTKIVTCNSHFSSASYAQRQNIKRSKQSKVHNTHLVVGGGHSKGFKSNNSEILLRPHSLASTTRSKRKKINQLRI